MYVLGVREFNGAFVVHLDLSDEENKAYLHAIKLFNSKYFWECHEVLEEIWLIKQAPFKTFLQGIIQAAAAFYHVLGENPKGTLKLAQDSLAKLDHFEAYEGGLNVEELRSSLRFFHHEANEILAQKKKEFSLDKIPVLKISGVQL